MALYGVLPTAGAMFAVAMVHAVSDGLTVSSTGVAVGMVVPTERQAGAQGVLGGLQTLTAGVTAPIIGTLYEHAGRTTAYTVSAAMMVVLIVVGAVLARGSFALRGGVERRAERVGAHRHRRRRPGVTRLTATQEANRRRPIFSYRRRAISVRCDDAKH